MITGNALHILIVDDDEVDRQAVRRALHRGLSDAAGTPPTIVEVSSGADALTALHRDPRFSVVVLDHEMPGMNGVETVRAIRAAGWMLPVLVTTGREDEILGELMAAGASDFLQKADFTPEAVRRRIAHMQRLAEAEAQAERARAEVARESQRTAAILDQLPIATVTVSPAGAITWINRQAMAMFGIENAVDPSKITASPLAAALTGEASQPLEFKLAAADGTERVLRSTTMPYHLGETTAGAVVVIEDLTEDRQIRDGLARALATRDEMLAIVSHDLRNPLHAVALAIDELADPALEAELRTRYVAAIRRSLGRASQLIRDLLDVSRLDAGGLVLERYPIKVRDLVDVTVRDHAMLFREAGMTARVTIEPEIAELVVHVDAQRTAQALGNLVGNAINYARGTETIDVIARRAGADIELVIADRGPGIDPANLPHLFDRFYQAETRRRAGAGLGLAIARGIARAHGGDLSAHARDGGGAEFRYRLHLA